MRPKDASTRSRQHASRSIVDTKPDITIRDKSRFMRFCLMLYDCASCYTTARKNQGFSMV